MSTIRNIFMYIRFFFPSLIIRYSEELLCDLERWKEINKISGSNWQSMAALLWQKKEFRNLVVYRLGKYPIRRRLVALFYPLLESLYIETPVIGGGLYIQHGFATMIAAKSIGKNCWINQQVTIGYRGNGNPPVLGDWVVVTCGAKVLGDITIGNHVTVGANAVVINNVPEHCVVGGVPAKVLKKND